MLAAAAPAGTLQLLPAGGHICPHTAICPFQAVPRPKLLYAETPFLVLCTSALATLTFTLSSPLCPSPCSLLRKGLASPSQGQGTCGTAGCDLYQVNAARSHPSVKEV